MSKEKNSVYIIRFTKPWRNYTTGDVAGFGEVDAKVILEGVIETVRTPAGPKKRKHGPWGKQVRKTNRATLQKEQAAAAGKERIANLKEQSEASADEIETFKQEAESSKDEAASAETDANDARDSAKDAEEEAQQAAIRAEQILHQMD